MNVEDLYRTFRYEQGNFLNRPVTIPKNISAHIDKMKIPQRDSLKTAALYFQSKWININPLEYIRCGFEIFGKGFTYIHFFDERIMRLYIQRDKNKKRETDLNKQELINSTKFVYIFLKDNNILFEDYLKLTDNKQKIIISHYLKNNISTLFLCYWIYNKTVILNEEDKMFLPYINSQYRQLIPWIKKTENIFIAIEEKLYGFRPNQS